MMPAILLLAFLSGQTSGAESSLEQKVAQTDWAMIRGVNFIPSYASNPYEIWRHYDREIFDRELRLVEAVGYNSVRLWLSYRAFEELGPEMVNRVADALQLCEKRGLRAVVVIFDSCGVRLRKDVRLMTASEAYDHFLASPRLSPEEKNFLRVVFEKHSKGFGAKALIPVASDSPIMVLLWQNWQPSPGKDRLGPQWYSDIEGYAVALFDKLQNNSTILFWDLMNEPEFAGEGPFSAKLLITPELECTRDAFLRHFREYLRTRYPNEPVAIGWADLENCVKFANLTDVLTFHIYCGPEELRSTIKKARDFSRRAGKPIVITETLANWDFGSPNIERLASDGGQLEHYQKVLPVLLESEIGWMAWGMVVSRVFSPYCDIFYPDGHPRPAGQYLEQMLKDE